MAACSSDLATSSPLRSRGSSPVRRPALSSSLTDDEDDFEPYANLADAAVALRSVGSDFDPPECHKSANDYLEELLDRGGRECAEEQVALQAGRADHVRGA